MSRNSFAPIIVAGAAAAVAAALLLRSSSSAPPPGGSPPPPPPPPPPEGCVSTPFGAPCCTDANGVGYCTGGLPHRGARTGYACTYGDECPNKQCVRGVCDEPWLGEETWQAMIVGQDCVYGDCVARMDPSYPAVLKTKADSSRDYSVLLFDHPTLIQEIAEARVTNAGLTRCTPGVWRAWTVQFRFYRAGHVVGTKTQEVAADATGTAVVRGIPVFVVADRMEIRMFLHTWGEATCVSDSNSADPVVLR